MSNIALQVARPDQRTTLGVLNAEQQLGCVLTNNAPNGGPLAFAFASSFETMRLDVSI